MNFLNIYQKAKFSGFLFALGVKKSRKISPSKIFEERD